MEFTPERALILKDTAIIADLHLGLENVMLEKGVAIPRIQVKEIVSKVKTILEKYNVNRLVIAGDLKHEFGGNLPYEWEDVELLLKNVDVEFVVVRGNHDNYLATILKKFGVELLESFNLYGWTVVHGHKECDAQRIIMGHEHPAVKLRIDGIYTFHCFLRIRKPREVIVLPAFSPLVSGMDILSCRFISPILRDVKCEDVEVYAVDEEVVFLGTLEDLKAVVQS